MLSLRSKMLGDAMTVKVTPLDATLGAELSGARLSDLDHETWTQIEEAFNEYAVLIARDQFLTLDEQLAFGARFGQLARNDPSRRGRPGRNQVNTPDDGQEFFAPVVGNVDKSGQHHAELDEYVRGGLANDEWHSDSSFRRLGSIVSILAGIEVPTSGGGQTEFADMRAAYDALPPKKQEHLASLRAYHSTIYSRVAHGAMEMELPDDLTTLDGAEHSMVRVHPITRRHALVIGSHVAHIGGMDNEESHRFAQELCDEACQPPRVFSHQWREGDVVMWDNRSVLHRGRPYDYSERRLLQHVRVVGEWEF